MRDAETLARSEMKWILEFFRRGERDRVDQRVQFPVTWSQFPKSWAISSSLEMSHWNASEFGSAWIMSSASARSRSF